MHPSEPYDAYWFFRTDLQLCVVGIILSSQPKHVFTGLQREPFFVFDSQRSYLLTSFDIVERVGLLSRDCAFCSNGRLRARATRGWDDYGNPLTTEWDGWEWSGDQDRPRPDLPMCWCALLLIASTTCTSADDYSVTLPVGSTTSTDSVFTEQSEIRTATDHRPRRHRRPLSRSEVADLRQRSRMLSRRPPQARR